MITGSITEPRRAGLRRVVVRRVRVVEPALVLVVAEPRPVVAGFFRAPDTARLVLVAARLVVAAARLVVVTARRLVEAARRRVVVEPPRTTCLACLVSPSMRLRTLLTSARVLAFFTWLCSVLIAARAVLSASR